MLGVNAYSQDHVDRCRAWVAAQLQAYDGVAAGADAAALAAFEPLFFNSQVLALDGWFTHRLRGLEKKDGNPLNEVRVLAASLVAEGVLVPDKTIRLKPETSVLGYADGDTIAVDRDGFARLAEAFLAEIEAKFVGMAA